jgi:hypothetical protein
MKYTKILFLLFIFVNVSQAMDTSPLWEFARRDALSCVRNIIDISPLWESVRKDALECAQSNYKKDRTRAANQLLSKICSASYIDGVSPVNGVLPLIRQEALFGIIFLANDQQREILIDVMHKAQMPIKKKTMHYCLRTLEYFFTHETDNYEKFEEKSTFKVAKLLLLSNIEKFTTAQNAQLFP